MIFVEFDIEAQLADLDIGTNHALILGLINELPLAARALEGSVVLWQPFGPVSRSTDYLSNSFSAVVLHGNLLLLFFVPLRVFVQLVKPVWTPIRPTERALQGLPVGLVVLEAPSETVSVDLPPAAIETVTQVLRFAQGVTAHAAHLVIFQRPWRHLCSLELLLLSS